MSNSGRKTAVIVAGPESSGTRLATQALIACGCIGNDGHEQEWDVTPPTWQDPIVWRRSFPHRTEWIHLSRLADKLVDASYDIKVVLTVRDWESMALSQINAGHVASLDQANMNIARAYNVLFEQVRYYPFTVVIYEELSTRPEHVVEWLSKRLGLKRPRSKLKTYDANAKYFGGKK